MAVEIRELVIKAVIVDDQSDDYSSASGMDAVEKQDIIQACVDQVLKIIKRGKNR